MGPTALGKNIVRYPAHSKVVDFNFAKFQCLKVHERAKVAQVVVTECSRHNPGILSGHGTFELLFPTNATLLS